MTDADHSNGSLYHYEYDAAGNRLLKQQPGETVVYTYDSANQLTHVGGAPTVLDAKTATCSTTAAAATPTTTWIA